MAIALIHKKTLPRSRLFRLVGNAKGRGNLMTGRMAINYLLRSLNTLFKNLPVSFSPNIKSLTPAAIAPFPSLSPWPEGEPQIYLNPLDLLIDVGHLDVERFLEA